MAIKTLRLATVAIFAVLLAGCGGGAAEVRSEVTTTTKGQQLMDLKKAHESGALTQEEYERERKKVLQKE